MVHAWNVPSEEIYTSPDPLRVNGHVRLSRPAVVGGGLIHDVRLAFEDGEVVQVTGGAGVEGLRAFIARDGGTRRVGEIALVDSDSAVAQIDRRFGLILLDENVAARILPSGSASPNWPVRRRVAASTAAAITSISPSAPPS